MRVLFYSFSITDEEYTELRADEIVSQWKQSEQGQWVQAHARDLRCVFTRNPMIAESRIDLLGKIEDGPLVTEYLLKWNSKQYW